MSGNGNLRPYYDSETFRSPVKGHNGLSIVHGTTLIESSNSSNTHGITGSTGGVSSSTSTGGSGGFVYLDASDNLNAIAMSLTRLYAKTLVSQPFEISRLLLQVGDWRELEERTEKGEAEGESRETIKNTSQDDDNDEDDEDEDDDEINYFTAVSGDFRLEEMRKKIRIEKRNNEKDRQKLTTGSSRTPSPSSPSLIKPKSIHIFDIISALNEKDGIKGQWRGLHTTFILDGLTSMVSAWLSGFLSSISGVPDPQFVEVLHSPSPISSLGTAVTAAVLTAVLLSPIDIIRTRFAISTFTTEPRSFRQSMIKLKSYTSPWLVLVPTILQSGLTSLIHLSTPYILYTRFGVDMFSSPSLYNIMSLISSLMELSIKLPLETLTRRSHIDSLNLKSRDLIVVPKKYSGIVGSFWDIIIGKDHLNSLFRGWRVSVVGVVGEWGVRAIQNVEKEREHF